MKDSLKIETTGSDGLGLEVHDILEVWRHLDGDIMLKMSDLPEKQTIQMWITQEDAANFRDFLSFLLKGTKFDPDQNISQ